MWLNGKDLSRHRRGVNVVVVDGRTGEFNRSFSPDVIAAMLVTLEQKNLDDFVV